MVITGTTTINMVSKEMYKKTAKQLKKLGKKLPEDIKKSYISVTKWDSNRTSEDMYKGANISKPPYFEPKRINRFKLKFPKKFNIPEWAVKTVSELSFPFNENQFSVILYDPIEPSSTATLMKLVKKPKDFKIKLEMLDPTGGVVEKWKLSGCKIININWCPLDYSDDEPRLIALTITCNNIKIK